MKSVEDNNLPTIADLTQDINFAYQNDQLNLLLNQEPPAKWVKTHPYIKTHRYLPIDKIEFLLRRIFKKYRIEITGQGQSFDGVWVTVRVHYLNPISNEMEWHDGIGAESLQLRKQTDQEKELGQKVVFSVENINKGAISMAFPIAKTLAVKDACDHLGKLFGADLNRKDTIAFQTDANLAPINYNELKELFELKRDVMNDVDIEHVQRILDNKEEKSYKKLYRKLKSL